MKHWITIFPSKSLDFKKIPKVKLTRIDRALDDMGEVSLTATLKEFHEVLTPYGQALLQGKRTLLPPTAVFAD
jgi:hypothetical protein